MSTEKNRKITLSEAFNPTTIRKGLFLFIGITLIVLAAIFIYTNTGKTLDVWKQIKVPYILAALVFLYLDLYLGSWRNHIIVQAFYPGKSQWVSFRANLANIFMGAVTPSQSGGGLAQLYIYYKNGVSVPNAITVSVVNWISTLFFFLVSGGMAYFIIQDRIPDGFVSYLAKFGFTVFTTLFVLVMVALFFPNVIGWVVQKLAGMIAIFNKKWKAKLTNFGIKAKTTLIDYRNKCTNLLRRKPQIMLYSLILTFTLYFNKYLLAYILVIAFGLDIDFWVVISVMALLYLLLYFAPSPGGSGIAELSIAGLMAGIMNEDYLASFILLNRSFLVFIPVILGVFVVLRQIGRETIGALEEQEKKPEQEMSAT